MERSSADLHRPYLHRPVSEGNLQTKISLDWSGRGAEGLGERHLTRWCAVQPKVDSFGCANRAPVDASPEFIEVEVSSEVLDLDHGAALLVVELEVRNAKVRAAPDRKELVPFFGRHVAQLTNWCVVVELGAFHVFGSQIHVPAEIEDCEVASGPEERAEEHPRKKYQRPFPPGHQRLGVGPY